MERECSNIFELMIEECGISNVSERLGGMRIVTQDLETNLGKMLSPENVRSTQSVA